MKKNVLPLVVIALVVAVLSTGIFYGLIVSRMDGSANAAASLRYVAATDLEKGRVLKASDFRLNSAPDPGVAAPTRAEDLLGRSLKEAVSAGKVITEQLLTAFSDRGLPNGIPDGMRAVTLHVAESSSVVQMLQPGDRVDIQSLLNRNRNGEPDLEVRTLQQNATVYAVGPPETNSPMQGRAVLTVLSTPQDAERLTAGDAGARLRIVLRGRKDDKIVALNSTTLLGLGSAPKAVVTSHFVAAAPVAAPVRRVEKLDLELNLLELSREQLASFAPGAREGVLSVSASGEELQTKLAELQSSGKGAILATSRLQTERAGDFSWKAADLSSLHVRIEPLASNPDGSTQLRIQPESSAPSAGATETRRVESNVMVASRHSALVSGLSFAGKGAHGGELLLVITPASRK